MPIEQININNNYLLSASQVPANNDRNSLRCLMGMVTIYLSHASKSNIKSECNAYKDPLAPKNCISLHDSISLIVTM